MFICRSCSQMFNSEEPAYISLEDCPKCIEEDEDGESQDYSKL